MKEYVEPLISEKTNIPNIYLKILDEYVMFNSLVWFFNPM